MSGNALNATVPSVFATLPNLEFLYLSDAFISGDLSYMEGMDRMIEHWIDFNPGFGGTIPAFVGDITTLGSLSVTQTNLIGELPLELVGLFRLETLWLYGNFLTGAIRPEYGPVWSRLKVFRVEQNQLTGSMPSSICIRRSNNFPPGNLQVLGGDYTLAVSHSNVSCEKCLFFH